jgi:hypothetical protein
MWQVYNGRKVANDKYEQKGQMGKQLKFYEMVHFARQSLEGAPDYRQEKNCQCEIADAGLGAFSVYHMQSPSFLAHQRDAEAEGAKQCPESL